MSETIIDELNSKMRPVFLTCKNKCEILPSILSVALVLLACSFTSQKTVRLKNIFLGDNILSNYLQV